MKLPRDLRGSEVVRALQRLGFVTRLQTGSHVILRHGERTVVVPQHKPLKPGTLNGVIEQAAFTIEDMMAQL